MPTYSSKVGLRPAVREGGSANPLGGRGHWKYLGAVDFPDLRDVWDFCSVYSCHFRVRSGVPSAVVM